MFITLYLLPMSRDKHGGADSVALSLVLYPMLHYSLICIVCCEFVSSVFDVRLAKPVNTCGHECMRVWLISDV